MKFINTTVSELETLSIQKRFRNPNEVLKYLANLTNLFSKAEKSLDNVLHGLHPTNIELSASRVVEFGDQDDVKPTLTKTPGVKPTHVEADKKTIEALNEYYSVLKTYSEALSVLEAQIIQWKSNPDFQPVFSTILKEATACKKKLEKSIQAAHSTISTLANKKLPPAFGKAISEVAHTLETSLKGRYEKVASSTLLTVESTKPLILVFTHYFQFFNLRDDSGAVEPEYYVVLTYKLDDEGGTGLFVTTMKTKEIPGKFHVGDQVSSVDKALVSLELQMNADAFDSVLHDVDLPVDDTEIKRQFKTDLKNFVSIQADNSGIVCFLKKTPSESDLNTLITDVRNVLGTLGNGRLRYSPQMSKRFSLTIPDRKTNPTNYQLDTLGYAYQKDGDSINFLALGQTKDSMAGHANQIRSGLDALGFTERKGYKLTDGKLLPVIIFTIRPSAKDRERAVTNRDFMHMLERDYHFDKKMLNQWRNLNHT